MIGKAVRGSAVLALAGLVVVRILTRQNRGEPHLYQREPEPEPLHVPDEIEADTN